MYFNRIFSGHETKKQLFTNDIVSNIFHIKMLKNLHIYYQSTTFAPFFHLNMFK